MKKKECRSILFSFIDEKNLYSFLIIQVIWTTVHKKLINLKKCQTATSRVIEVFWTAHKIWKAFSHIWTLMINNYGMRLLIFGSEWKFSSWLEQSEKGPKPKQAKHGHFIFLADTKQPIFQWDYCILDLFAVKATALIQKAVLTVAVWLSLEDKSK